MQKEFAKSIIWRINRNIRNHKSIFMYKVVSYFYTESVKVLPHFDDIYCKGRDLC